MSNEDCDRVAPGIDVVINVDGFPHHGANKLELGMSLTPKGFEGYSAVPVDRTSSSSATCRARWSGAGPRCSFIEEKAVLAGGAMLPSKRLAICIVTFSDSARAIVELCQATDANKAITYDKIDRISEEGGTQMSKGLAEVLRQRKKVTQAAAKYIMLTDGDDGDAKCAEALDQRSGRSGKAGVNMQVSPRGALHDFVFPQVNAIKLATNGKRRRVHRQSV